MKLVIIDKSGLCYDGDTFSKQGRGGSESAVILPSKKLAKIGFDVTFYNNCKDGYYSKTGLYDGVRYINDAKQNQSEYDIIVISKTVLPFIRRDWYFLDKAKKKILWLHDTFIEGIQITEKLVNDWTMLYPSTFTGMFGISVLELLLYKTPLADSVIQYLETIGFYLVSNFHKESVDGDYHFSKTKIDKELK
jgi:hypothetical protein